MYLKISSDVADARNIALLQELRVPKILWDFNFQLHVDNFSGTTTSPVKYFCLRSRP